MFMPQTRGHEQKKMILAKARRIGYNEQKLE
jgi:hypothetical protein